MLQAEPSATPGTDPAPSEHTVTTTLAYDPLSRLIQSVDPLAGISGQAFDPDGNRNQLSDPNGNDTDFAHDWTGRTTDQTTAAASTTQYQYDPRGLLEQSTNARGQTREYAYDPAGQTTQINDLDGTITYAYDPNGNLLTNQETSGNGTDTITRTYDALNRIKTYTNAHGETLRYHYDNRGNLQTLTYPDGKQVHYHYDAANQPATVTDWANRVTQYQYDENGKLIRTDRPNGTYQAKAYDAKGKLIDQADYTADGSLITAYHYDYNPAGEIIREWMLPEPPDYLADLLPPQTMTYTAANRLATVDGQTIQFDHDGNLTQGPLNNDWANYTYNSRNQLTQVESNDQTTTYRYDSEGHRIAQSQDGQATRYTINPHAALSHVLIQHHPDGTKTHYVHGLGLIGEQTATNYTTYHYDYRGSTTALTDQSGTVTHRFQYSPYGKLLKVQNLATGTTATNPTTLLPTATTATPFLYNGMYGVMTDGNGLYHMRARYYHPDLRRFINRDVLLGHITKSQTLDRFAYANGNPVRFIDPDGEMAATAIVVGTTVTMGIAGYGAGLAAEYVLEEFLIYTSYFNFRFLRA